MNATATATAVKVTRDNADTWIMPRTGGRRFLIGQWLVIDATGTVRKVCNTRTLALAYATITN